MLRNLDELLESLARENPDALTLDGLDRALIGRTLPGPNSKAVAVYLWPLAVQTVLDKMHQEYEGDGPPPSESDAEEDLVYNTLGAHVGKDGPIFIEITHRLAWGD